MRKFVGMAAGALLGLSAVAAQGADRAIIVLDGSGSMWGQIDGRAKLEIARETLAEVLPTLPADLEQMFADYLAIGLPYDAQQQQALRNQFSSPETLTYLATRDGDRVKLVPVQTTAGNDETADAEGAMICARITCPE